MSGGHFDYNCFRISQFAEELQHEIEINDETTENEYGDRIGHNYNKPTQDRLVKIQKLIEKAGLLAREVEWLYSGDHGEESFNKLVDEIGVD